MVTETQLNKAKARERATKAVEPRVLAVSCDGERIHLELAGVAEGLLVSFPVVALPFLSTALPKQLQRVGIVSGGEAIEWPELGEVVAVRGLLEHLTGLHSLSAMQKGGALARAKGDRPRKLIA